MRVWTGSVINQLHNYIRIVEPLFKVEGEGSIPTSPLKLKINVIPTKVAVNLNRLWHSRLPKITNPFSAHTICFGAEYKNVFFACAIWTDPIARLFNGRGFLELRRMAISPDAPRNTASRMLSVMAKTISKEMPDIIKLISYQDTEVHRGTIYKASGWSVSEKTKGGSACHNVKQSWKMPNRVRDESQSTAFKVRWEKVLKRGRGV